MSHDTPNNKRAAKRRRPPRNLREWKEYWFLWVTSATFRSAPDKRKAFYEHLLARHYERRFR